MVDAIGGFSTGPWTPSFDDDGDDEARRRTAALATAKPKALPELPDPPPLSGALLARAARAAAAPRLLLAMGVDATDVRPDQDTAVQKRLDTFYASARPTYRLPEGTEVTVATPFRMDGTGAIGHEADPTLRRYAEQEGRVMRRREELTAIARSVGIGDVRAIKVGRGTPHEVRTLTQALIDAGKLPPAVPGQAPEARVLQVRQMMCDYGIGFDCAGYTQQALLAAHNVTRAQAGLRPKIMNEDLSNLAPHFTRVATEDVRAGDIISLAAPTANDVGHRVIVVDRHDASSEELTRFRGLGEGAKLGGQVSVLTVDSSFGSGADPERGGVQRQTWLYDAANKQWGRLVTADVPSRKSASETVTVSAKPYDGHHALIGIYRFTDGH